MCGISGIISAGRKDAVTPMTEALAHRGPDGCGYYRDERIALGQRRLSIIDLVTGDQPIGNETGDVQLICNGEIYNSPELRRRLLAAGHRFRTQTDVEVIVHLYEDLGTACVKELRGMFAFASIPGALKLKGNQLKYVLRKVAGRYLPRELIDRPKQGFGFPLAIWMRTEMRDFVRNLFAESRLVELGIFERAYVQRLADEHIAGKIDHNYRLWLLINLEIWYRMYFEGMSVEPMQQEIGRLMVGGARGSAGPLMRAAE